MKTFIFITLSLILARVSVYAQQNNLERIDRADTRKPNSNSHYYIYDNNLNKFAGTWIGHYKEESVRIILFKKGIPFNKTDDNELEILTGSLQYFENDKLKADYTGNEILQGSAISKDTLNILVSIKSRNAHASLIISYLKDGTIKLEIEQNRFEFKNDKDFELKEPIILTKQN